METWYTWVWDKQKNNTEPWKKKRVQTLKINAKKTVLFYKPYR